MVSQDEAFDRALSAMYWGGYWTAVYHVCFSLSPHPKLTFLLQYQRNSAALDRTQDEAERTPGPVDEEDEDDEDDGEDDLVPTQR
jgi:hypothetical protein